MCKYLIACFLMLLAIAPYLPAQENSASAPNGSAVFMVVFRTPAHVRYSQPQVFHGFASDLYSFLKEKNVPIRVDPERGTIETESPMSVESMLNIARQVQANSLLFVTVDRPMTKWIRVTLRSYDLSGKLLWQEEASDAGSMTGKGGYQKTLRRIEASLSKRLGTPGLPVRVQPSGTSKPAEEGARP